MATLKCNTCGGIYRDVLPDGLRYFHTCPPFTPRELDAAIRAGTYTLSAADAQRLDDARAADAKTPVEPGELTREEVVFQSLVIARPGARDENVDEHKVHEARLAVGGRVDELDPRSVQKAPGAGVTVLAAGDAV